MLLLPLFRHRDEMKIYLRAIFIGILTMVLAYSCIAQISPTPSNFVCDEIIFNESFEGGIPVGWNGVALDAYKSGTSFNQGWVIDRDTTFTPDVGPNGAQDGDFYVYCDGSGPIGRGSIASMTTPLISIPDVNAPALTFYLNMHGQSGSFMVNIIDGATKTQVIAPVDGDVLGGIHMADEWEPIYVDLSAYKNKDIQIEFGATKPSAPTTGSKEGDISVDNIVICSSVPTIPTLGQWGLILLSLLVLIIGINFLKQYNYSIQETTN